MKFLYFIFIFIYINTQLLAQNEATQIESQKSLGVETAVIMGYTGFNQFLGPVLSRNNSQVYIGPKINLNTYYLPGHTHLGLNAGYRYSYLESEKFSSFISLDYQLSFYKLYDPHSYFSDNTKNNVQELIIGLGSQYTFMHKLSTNLSFGFGAYREKFHTIEDDKANDDFYGLTINARLSLQYKLFSK